MTMPSLDDIERKRRRNVNTDVTGKTEASQPRKKQARKNEALNINISTELNRMLEDMAARTSQTKTAIVSAALYQFLTQSSADSSSALSHWMRQKEQGE